MIRITLSQHGRLFCTWLEAEDDHDLVNAYVQFARLCRYGITLTLTPTQEETS